MNDWKLTEREFFTAMALIGLLSAKEENAEGIKEDFKWIAVQATRAADEVIAELSEKGARNGL